MTNKSNEAKNSSRRSQKNILSRKQSISTVICIIMAFTEELKLSIVHRIVHAFLELTGFPLTVLTDSIGNLT